MTKRTRLIFAIAIGGAGLILIGWYASWQVALGVFLALWANNLDYEKRS